MASERQQVVVVGAGVSGLTSAICLGEAGWPVRVWAAALPQQTTSRVAGAVWAPPRPSGRAVQTQAWTEHSLRVFRELADDPSTGVQHGAGTGGRRPVGGRRDVIGAATDP